MIKERITLENVNNYLHDMYVRKEGSYYVLMFRLSRKVIAKTKTLKEIINIIDEGVHVENRIFYK